MVPNDIPDLLPWRTYTTCPEVAVSPPCGITRCSGTRPVIGIQEAESFVSRIEDQELFQATGELKYSPQHPYIQTSPHHSAQARCKRHSQDEGSNPRCHRRDGLVHHRRPPRTSAHQRQQHHFCEPCPPPPLPFTPHSLSFCESDLREHLTNPTLPLSGSHGAHATLRHRQPRGHRPREARRQDRRRGPRRAQGGARGRRPRPGRRRLGHPRVGPPQADPARGRGEGGGRGAVRAVRLWDRRAAKGGHAAAREGGCVLCL